MPDHTEPCPDCGGNCAPGCGRHPAGCIYTVPSWYSYVLKSEVVASIERIVDVGESSHGFWMACEGCELNHGEQESD